MRVIHDRAARTFALALVLAAGSASPVFSQQLEDRERSSATAYSWFFDVSVATIGDMVSQGYRIVDVEVDSGSPLRVHAALTRNAGVYGKGWWWYFGFTEAQVGDALRNNNARLIDIEAYDDGSGATKFFAIMIANTGADGAAWSWQFNTSLGAIQQHLRDYPGDRIVDLDQYTIGQRSYFSAIYIKNTDAHARAWWWYVGVAGDQIDSIARANAAMIVDIEPTGSGTFNLLMQRVPGGNPGWWWYVGVDADTVGNALRQNDARPISVKRWWTYDGDRFAVVMVSNTGSTGGNPPGEGTPPPAPPPSGGNGQVMLWMDSNLGQLETVVNGARGTITSYYPNGAPSCGASGAVTVTLPVGSQASYSASCVQRNPLTGQSQLQWHGIATVAAGCTAIKLTAQSRCDGTPNGGAPPPPTGGGPPPPPGAGNPGGGIPGAVSPQPYSACPQAFVDSTLYNWVAFRNTCSQAIHLTWFYGNGDRVGSGANIAAGGKASTGYTQSELQQRGGFVVYPCPLGYRPVDSAGRPIEYGGQRQQYVCRPQ